MGLSMFCVAFRRVATRSRDVVDLLNILTMREGTYELLRDHCATPQVHSSPLRPFALPSLSWVLRAPTRANRASTPPATLCLANSLSPGLLGSATRRTRFRRRILPLRQAAHTPRPFRLTTEANILFHHLKLDFLQLQNHRTRASRDHTKTNHQVVSPSTLTRTTTGMSAPAVPVRRTSM